MKRRRVHIPFIVQACVAATAIVVATSGCALLATNTDVRTGEVIDLESVEVREYQGKRLDSVGEFRENSIKGPQSVDVSTYRLSMTGMVASPQRLTYEQVIDRPAYKKVVRLNCVEGWSVDILWEGVRIVDLLEQAGYDPSGKVVIFSCEDGYTTSLPLETVIERDLLLAYRMNGIDLPAERGYPFQVVAEDKLGYKWAKWVTGIEVSNDANYKGYWESRGYDNDADVAK